MLTIDPVLLTSLAHPCIGAFIGYLTNKIAIRMLFRPLRPWTLFGMRVPMTPGVIPSKRHDLAVNIGEMVGRHLLTSKDIGAAISEEPFQDHLALLADRRVREIFTRDLGPVAEIIPLRFRSYFQVGVKTLKYQVAQGVISYVAGKDFEEKFAAAMSSHLATLGGQEVDSLLDAENRRGIYLFLDEVIRALLVNEQTEIWLGGHLAEQLRQAAAQGRTVGDLLPDQLTDLLHTALRTHAGPILNGMGKRLADPELRGQVVKGITEGVNHFLDGLGPMGAMARGFLETDTFEHKIGAYLDEREGDLIAWLQNPEVQQRMVAVLEDSLDALLGRQLDALLAEVDAAHLDTACRSVANQLLAACTTEGAMTSLRAMLHVGLETLMGDGRRPLAELTGQFLPGDHGRRMQDTLIRECLSLLRSGASERLVHSMVGAMFDGLLARPLGRLYDIVPHGVRQGLVDYIMLTVNRMLLQEVPGVVESLNIRRVVADKVDSLDLLQLERLLLSIMEEQFKYINLFGALLGFLIGLVNLALTKVL